MDITLTFERYGYKYNEEFVFRTKIEAAELENSMISVVKKIMKKSAVSELLNDHNLGDIKYLCQHYDIIDSTLPIRSISSGDLIVVCNSKYEDTNCNLFNIIFAISLLLFFLVIGIMKYLRKFII